MTEERLPSALNGMIQVAGVLSYEEAAMLLEEGVHQVGFPLRLPVHQEDTSEEEAAAIIRRLPTRSAAVLITYLSEAADLLAFCRELGVQKVQVHSPLSVEEASKLKALDANLFLIKSLVVCRENQPELLQCIEDLAPYVDAFITDTYDSETGASGATGKTHDWEISRKLVRVSPRPVILAGGLDPLNVRRAITQVRPAGVDVHTGVEGPDGRKDRGLVRAFVARVRESFALL